MLSLDFKKYISITEKQGFSAWAHSRAALSAGRVSKVGSGSQSNGSILR